MKRIHYVIVMMCLFITSGFAHDANKSFFKIEQKNNVVEVQAEFPWSIRNAVMEAFPELESSNNKKDFETAFFNYIDANFSIRNSNVLLSLVSVKEVDIQSHSHQNNFVFVFAGNNFDTVTNTVMFNIYDNQKNFHDVEINKEYEEFVTTSENTSFKINLESDSESSIGNDTIVIALALVFSILMTLLFFKTKKKLV